MLTQSLKREDISWKTVVAVGGVAWLVVACLTGAVWTLGRQPTRTSALLTAAPNVPSETPRRTEVAQRPPLTQAPPKSEGSRAGADGKEPVPSPQKLPAGLALADREQGRIALPQGLPMSEQAFGIRPVDFDKHSTQVAFVGSPPEAARLAAKERKLLFLLHLSGNFEEAGFT